MAEGKGHTELPWMAASAYSSVCGVPIVNQQGRRIFELWLADLNRAITASKTGGPEHG